MYLFILIFPHNHHLPGTACTAGRNPTVLVTAKRDMIAGFNLAVRCALSLYVFLYENV